MYWPHFLGRFGIHPRDVERLTLREFNYLAAIVDEGAGQ